MIQEKIRLRIEEELKIDLDQRRPSGKHNREKEYVYARAIYYRLLYEFTTMNNSMMAKSLGQHHATVLHSRNNVFPYLSAWGENKYVELYLAIKKELEPVKEQIREEARRAMDFRAMLKDNIRLKVELEAALKMVNDESNYIQKYTAAKYQLGRLKWLVRESRIIEANKYLKEIESINP